MKLHGVDIVMFDNGGEFRTVGASRDGRILRIESGEALIEDDERCALHERTRHVDAAPLAVGELPA